MKFHYDLQPGQHLSHRFRTDHIHPLVSIVTPFYNSAAYWEQTLDAALAVSPWQMGGGVITLPRDLLRQQPAAVRLRLYLRALRLLNRQHGGQARAERLLALDAAWQAGRGNTRFQFPGGLMATLRAGAVTFAHAADDEGASPPAEDSGLPSRPG